MNRAGKIGLAVGGVMVGGLVLALVATRKASATPLEIKPPLEPKPEDIPPANPQDGVVVVPDVDDHDDQTPPIVVTKPPEPEGGFVRDSPFSVPGIQDAAESERILLRWWSSEGESLMFSDTDESVDGLRAKGFPLDFGSGVDDLKGNWGKRQEMMARAFRFLSGFTDAKTLAATSGALTNELVLQLRRWAASQALPKPNAPSAPNEPAPQVIQSPGQPPLVLVPDLPPQQVPAPAVPVPALPLPPLTPQQAGPPPFVPPLLGPSVAPPVAVPAAPPVVLSSPLPPAAVPAGLPAATAPVPVPVDTARLVQALLADEASNGWKKISAAVQAWQKSRGLVQDGKFGPKSALTVAAEIGTVPLVRYWPQGSFKEGHWLKDFQAALLDLAQTAPEPRATQLRASAQREQGQGFGSSQQALPLSQQVQIAKVA